MTDLSPGDAAAHTNAARRYFDEHAATWDQRMPADYAAQLQAMMRPFAAEVQDAHIIVEIGTGTGPLIPVLSALAPNAVRISVDLAHAMLDQAHARDESARLLQADAHALPFASGSVDLVICHNSFPHFSDKRAALISICRVVRPGGQLLIIHNHSRERVNAVHQRIGGPLEHDHVLPGEEMHRLLIETGWSDVRVDDAPMSYSAMGRRV